MKLKDPAKITKALEKNMESLLIKAAKDYGTEYRNYLSDGAQYSSSELFQVRKNIREAVHKEMLIRLRTEINKQLPKKKHLDEAKLKSYIENTYLLSKRVNSSYLNIMDQMFQAIEAKADEQAEKSVWLKVIGPIAKMLAALLVASLITIVLAAAITLAPIALGALPLTGLASVIPIAPSVALCASTVLSSVISFGAALSALPLSTTLAALVPFVSPLTIYGSAAVGVGSVAIYVMTSLSEEQRIAQDHNKKLTPRIEDVLKEIKSSSPREIHRFNHIGGGGYNYTYTNIYNNEDRTVSIGVSVL
jgi:hypothetical protein